MAGGPTQRDPAAGDPTASDPSATQADLALRCAAYAVLRQGHPRLPELRLPPAGGDAAARVLSCCFAAARRLLADTPADAAALFAAPDPAMPWSPELVGHLNAAAAQAVDMLANDETADPLGPLFEAACAAGARRARGQHFTPAPVVALVLALARADQATHVMDPTCGTGAFLVHAAVGRRATTLWGCEVDPLTAGLARINLGHRGDGAARHVHTGDLLALGPGALVDGHALPRCDAVVGNLPYVRQRLQDLGRWREALGQRWAERDASLVTRDAHGAPALRLSGHADLYALLFFHLADLVAPGGRLALLTANAYLDAGYGRDLEQLFLRHFHPVALVESRCEPWFADASVNTVITVLERRADDARNAGGPAAAGGPVRFVQLTAPLLPDPDGPNGADDADGARPADPATPADPAALARTIEGASSPAPAAALPYTTVTAPGCRIRLVDPARLETALDGTGDPWSAYLRAPDVYFLLRGHPALRPLGDLATLRRGVTTNWNDFFYPPADAAVEDDYLVPVVRSPRVSRTIAVEAARLAHRLFVCERGEAALRQAGHDGARRWIAHGRRLTNRQGRPLPEALTGRPWYRLAPARHRLLLTKTTHDTHLHRLADAPVALDQRLYGVAPADPADTELLAALLNSSLAALVTEVVGSASLGDGALDLPVTTARQRLWLPDPAALPPAPRRRILDAFRQVARRPVLPVWREVERPDRQALDAAILAGLGLDPAALLPALYDGLCSLTRARLDLAARRRSAQRRAAARSKKDQAPPQGPT